MDIDWSKTLVGENQGAIAISGGTNAPVIVKLTAYKATAEQVHSAQGCFGGLVGPISFLTADFSANMPVGGVRWEKLPDYSRVRAAMEVFPVTAAIILPPHPAPSLEYPV